MSIFSLNNFTLRFASGSTNAPGMPFRSDMKSEITLLPFRYDWHTMDHDTALPQIKHLIGCIRSKQIIPADENRIAFSTAPPPFSMRRKPYSCVCLCFTLLRNKFVKTFTCSRFGLYCPVRRLRTARKNHRNRFGNRPRNY